MMTIFLDIQFRPSDLSIKEYYQHSDESTRAAILEGMEHSTPTVENCGRCENLYHVRAPKCYVIPFSAPKVFQ